MKIYTKTKICVVLNKNDVYFSCLSSLESFGCDVEEPAKYSEKQPHENRKSDLKKNEYHYRHDGIYVTLETLKTAKANEK